MPIISNLNDMLPKSWGGCKCTCHRQPGVMHVVACCHPGIKEQWPNWPFPKLPEEESVKKEKKKKKKK